MRPAVAAVANGEILVGRAGIEPATRRIIRESGIIP